MKYLKLIYCAFIAMFICILFSISASAWVGECPSSPSREHFFLNDNYSEDTGTYTETCTEDYCSVTYRTYTYHCMYCGTSGASGKEIVSSKSHPSWNVYISYTYSPYNSCYRQDLICTNCGYTDSSYHSHNTETTSSSSFTQSSEYCYGTDTSYKCKKCGITWTSRSGRSHRFSSWSSWSNFNSSQHVRSRKCSSCDYIEFSYGNHSLKYGSWTSYNDSQHRRSKSCSTCGLNTYEYANHTFKYTQIPGNYDNHYWSCSVCGDNNNLQAHTQQI